MKHSIGVQLAEVEREIRMRKQVYPHQVHLRKLRQSEADELIAIMSSVRDSLLELRELKRGEDSDHE